MTLPVAPMVRPASLADQPNGRLDVSLLSPVHGGGRLHVVAARAWRALVARAAERGLPLTYTYGGTYRTYQAQVDLFLRRFTTVDTGTGVRRWWDGRWWWLKQGVALAATPGTSNHGWALAVDMAYDRDTSDGVGPDDATGITGHPQWSWLLSNAPRFGWSWEVQSEPWHIRYVAGDNIPTAVTEWERGAVATLPPFDPARGLWGLWPIAAKPAVKEGDRSDAVRYLQGVLNLKGGFPCTVDGWFGAKTEAAVIGFQRKHGLTPDGWVGNQTWPVVDRVAVS